MTEESKVSGENSPQDQGAEWQNMDSPEENMSAGMSDEDQARYEEWMSKREAGVEMEDFEGETNQTFKKEHGKYVYDEDGNHVMRERSDSAFDLTPRLKGESNAHYGARLKYNNMLAQKAEEFPWSEEDIRYDDYGNRDRVKEQEDWRAKAGIPSFDEYFESLGGENGDPDAAETAEEEASESYWHKIGKEGQRELVHKHPRKMGESNEEWAKRIEEEEGRKIFTADMGANIPNETGASAEAENGSVDSQATEAQDRAAAGQGDVTADGGASAEEAASEEAVSESESQDVAEAIDSSVDPAAEVAGESDDAAVTETNEVTAESVEDSTDKKAEESAESAEAKEKQRLLDIVGTAEFATWLKEKGLTNGDVEGKTAEELQALIDEHESARAKKPEEEAKKEAAPDAFVVRIDGKEWVISLRNNKKEAQVEEEEKVKTYDDFAEERRKRADKLTKARVNGDRLSPEDLVFMKSMTFSERAKNGEFGELAEEIESGLDGAIEFRAVQLAWMKESYLLEASSDEVKSTVAYHRQERTVRNSESSLEEMRQRLERMPRFTLPWSKSRLAKNDLRLDIAARENSLKYERDRLEQLKGKLPETMSDEDSEKVGVFDRIDTRATIIHHDSNTRQMAKDIEQRRGEIETHPGETEYIARMNREIAELQHRIEMYELSHPDFVMNPDENYKNPRLSSAELIEDVDSDSVIEIVDDEDEEETSGGFSGELPQAA